MKKSIRTAGRRALLLRPFVTLTLGLLLALLGAALTYSTPPAMEGTIGGATFFLRQPTSTPQPDDLSEIGSTDGIVVMAFVIALIVIVPLFMHRKSWVEPP